MTFDTKSFLVSERLFLILLLTSMSGLFCAPSLLLAQGTGPSILSSNPPSGYIDPREDQNLSGTLSGINQISIIFSSPVRNAGGGDLTKNNFKLFFYRGGIRIENADAKTLTSPTVAMVTGTGAGPYSLTLSDRLPLKTFATIQPLNIVDTENHPLLPSNGPAQIEFAALPLDVNLDATVNGTDVDLLKRHFFSLENPSPGLHREDLVDFTRNGVISGEDFDRSKQLLSGVATYQIWTGASLGPSPRTFSCNGTASPVVSISAPSSGNVNQEINLEANATIDPSRVIIAYEWDFGDNSKAVGPNVSHAYFSAQTFPIRLTVTDNCGTRLSNTTSIVISNYSQPEVPPLSPPANPCDMALDFYVPDQAVVNQPFSFYLRISTQSPSTTIISSKGVTFSDGGSSTITPVPSVGFAVSRTFTRPGAYGVSGRVTRYSKDCTPSYRTFYPHNQYFQVLAE